MLSLADIDQGQLFRVGGSTVTVGGVVAGIAVFALAWLASRLVSRALCRLRDRSNRSAAALYLLEKLSSYGLVIIGAVAGLSAAGLDLSSLTIFAGAIGIGVGLGLQGVVKEFVSGIFLIFDRMVGVDDYVELDGGVRGVVAEIGPRATRIRSNDNINIVVPNSSLIEGRVTNWTLKGDTRRIHIPFAVAYGADRSQVRDAVLADALEQAGIEIPFPQTDLRLRSVFGREGDDALSALGLRHAGETQRPPAAGPGEARPQPKAPPVNDAAEDLMSSPDPREADDPPAGEPAPAR